MGDGEQFVIFLEDKIDTNVSSQLVESKPKFGEKGLCFMLPV